MRRRLYVVLPDLASAERIAGDLVQAGVDERHLHFLGPRGMPLAGLHEASALQKSDVAHALALGAYLGILGGLMLGLHLVRTPIGDEPFGVGCVLMCLTGGALFGAWAASLVGVSTPNWKLKGFDDEFAAGRILLMADVPRERVAEIHQLLAHAHPEAIERRVDAIPLPSRAC